MSSAILEALQEIAGTLMFFAIVATFVWLADAIFGERGISKKEKSAMWNYYMGDNKGRKHTVNYIVCENSRVGETFCNGKVLTAFRGWAKPHHNSEKIYTEDSYETFSEAKTASQWLFVDAEETGVEGIWEEM